MIDLQNKQCEKCGLCKLRTNVVNGKGSVPAKIMLVGEWPGSPEDQSGDIWSGPIGKEIRRILSKADINPYEVFLTTVVRCVPKDVATKKVREPSKEEIDSCADYLDKEIAAVQPNVIVPMGTIAAKRILGKVVTIKGTRGVEMWSDKYQCKVIPVYHPILLQRNPEHEGFTVEDFRRIKKSAEYKELTPKNFGKYIVIETRKQFDDAVARLNSVSAFAYDIETTGLKFMTDKVLCIAFTWQAHTGITIPIIRYVGKPKTEIIKSQRKIRKKINGQWVEAGFKEVTKEKQIIEDTYEPYWGEDQNAIISKLRDVFANSALKIAHNGKFDNKFLLKDLNIHVDNFGFDTMLAHHLLNENAEGMHDLKECAWNYTDMGGYEEALEQWFEANHSGTKKSRNYAHLPPELLYPYNAMDTDVTFQLYELFKPRIDQERLSELMSRWVMPLSETLTQAEVVGTLIDVALLEKYRSILEKEIKRREDLLISKVGKYDFNSNDQLSELFYEKLKLPILSTTAKGFPSCDEATLIELAKKHEIPQLVLNYREVNNMMSKYIVGLKNRLDTENALHTEFLIHGTVTGRLSSKNPNLQNIPRDPLYILDDEGEDTWVDKDTKETKKGWIIKIKNLFIPRGESVWIEADYGQAEFRHWANYSQDKDMIRDIIAADNGTGPDIHKKTASEAWKIPLDQVDKSKRDAAKRIVFGIMYGRQAESIAEQLGIEVSEAQRIIDLFLSKYPVAARWLKEVVAGVRIYGQVRDIFGRIRRLPGINSRIEYVREENERLAMNSPIQAAASDMNCNAANRIRLAFKDQEINGRILILVHDAIYVEVHKDDFDKGIQIMRDAMERPIAGVTVPMRAEFKTGDRWGNVQDYHFDQVAVA